MKPRLLVIELWGLGDLLIATPFLQAASREFDVTLLAKPYALDLQPRFWPDVAVADFVAPWTAFRNKYQIWRWPWRELFRLRRLRLQHFNLGLSARWDPRDHVLLMLLGARRRLGFPRLRSDLFLTDSLDRPHPLSHRLENWRALGRALGLDVPPKDKLALGSPKGRCVLIHSGAGQPVRVWPLPSYLELVHHLRRLGLPVQVACDPDQRQWWITAGEAQVATPHTVRELMAIIDQAGAFIGNDSGPSHLAAFCGVPNFTLFGPQLPEWFAPLHPAGECLEGKPCPYKPCSDYCRFPAPVCMVNLSVPEVAARVDRFLRRVLPGAVAA